MLATRIIARQDTEIAIVFFKVPSRKLASGGLCGVFHDKTLAENHPALEIVFRLRRDDLTCKKTMSTGIWIRTEI
jgi:hypothetical protein